METRRSHVLNLSVSSVIQPKKAAEIDTSTTQIKVELNRLRPVQSAELVPLRP